METSACESVGEILGPFPRGIVADLGEDRHREVIGPPRLDWHRARAARVLFGSDRVIASARGDYGEESDRPGIYFLILHGKVCYVGQSSFIAGRLDQHVKEKRPFTGVSMIVGIPKWAQDEIEHAYIRAWSPPWNEEGRRCGYLEDMPDYQARANVLDRSAVMPSYTPVVRHCLYKQWELQIIGYTQHLEREKAAG